MKKSIQILFAALALPVLPIHAQTAIDWNQTTTGSYGWNTTGNWNGGDVPDSVSETAQFNQAGFVIAADNVISINQNIADLTLGGITVASSTFATGAITITGSPISLDNNAAGRAVLSHAGVPH